MLFLVHWELNENVPEEQRLQAAQKLTGAGLFPPKGVNVLRFDATPDLWGVILMEASSVADVFRAVDIWRASVPGFFKTIKTAPAMPVQEILPLAAEIVKAVKS